MSCVAKGQSYRKMYEEQYQKHQEEVKRREEEHRLDYQGRSFSTHGGAVMLRPTHALLALALLLLAGPALAADVDPEPPGRGVAKAGGYTVKADKKGFTATNRDGQTVWRTNLLDGAGGAPQVAIDGDFVVIARQRAQAVLELGSGKMWWSRFGGPTNARMTVKNGRITLSAARTEEIIDLQTGKTLQEIKRR
jgi:hypothetical protein